MTLEEFSSKRSVPLSYLYKMMLVNDFKFGGKYPNDNQNNFANCHNNLENIISWNQELLDKNFRLGWTQNCREGYQQFLLLHPFYKHCRIITSSKYISLIIPENEMTFPDFLWYEDFKSLNMALIEPLKQLSLSVWSTGLVTSIQTAPENGGYRSYRDLLLGKLPFVCPFAVLDEICLQQIKRNNPNREFIEKKLITGVLVEFQEAIYGY